MTTKDGGKPVVKPLHYSPPQGPTRFNHEGPGLTDAHNHGNKQTHEPVHLASRRPGIGGTNKGNSGTERR
jgi:hypothetical protein